MENFTVWEFYLRQKQTEGDPHPNLREKPPDGFHIDFIFGASKAWGWGFGL